MKDEKARLVSREGALMWTVMAGGKDEENPIVRTAGGSTWISPE
jgi:hypothetical protein